MEPNPVSSPPRPGRHLLALLVFVILCGIVSGIGGVVTAASVDGWYRTLEKPWFNPPDWVFAPVWTILYSLIAIAGWRIWRYANFNVRKRLLAVYGLQLGLNLAWSCLFFGFQAVGLALLEIAILLIVIVVNGVMFWRIDRLAGAIFIPYALWVAYATLLNAALYMLNGG